MPGYRITAAAAAGPKATLPYSSMLQLIFSNCVHPRPWQHSHPWKHAHKLHHKHSLNPKRHSPTTRSPRSWSKTGSVVTSSKNQVHDIHISGYATWSILLAYDDLFLSAIAERIMTTCARTREWQKVEEIVGFVLKECGRMAWWWWWMSKKLSKVWEVRDSSAVGDLLYDKNSETCAFAGGLFSSQAAVLVESDPMCTL